MATPEQQQQQQQQQQEWDDARNWSFPGVYYAVRDARLVVPKRPVTVLGVELNLGWTFNFAHRGSVPALAALVALPVLALQLLPRSRRGGGRAA